jgi:hypothetical protein
MCDIEFLLWVCDSVWEAEELKAVNTAAVVLDAQG